MSAGATIAKTPKPPYYAVVFTSQRTEGERGYGSMAERMVEMAAKQPGFLGVESVRGADGFRTESGTQVSAAGRALHIAGQSIFAAGTLSLLGCSSPCPVQATIVE